MHGLSLKEHPSPPPGTFSQGDGEGLVRKIADNSRSDSYGQRTGYQMSIHNELLGERIHIRARFLWNEVAATRWILVIALISGAFLRIWQINAMGYNTDEAVYSGQAAAIAGVPVLENIFPIFRAHPLLFQVLLSLIYRIQMSDLAGRLFAVLIGLGTIYLTYQTGKLLYGNLPGALAALFIALMPYHVLVSRQVLLDGLMVFFATLTLFFLARFAQTEKPLWLYFTGASMGLTFLSKETSIVLLGAIYTFLALAADVHVRVKDLIVSIMLWLLVIAPFPASLLLTGGSTTGQNYLAWQLFRRPNHEWSFYLTAVSPAIGILLIFAALLGVVLLWRSRSWREKLLLVWVIVPIAFFQLWPVKGFQYLLPIAPPFAILAGRLLGRFASAVDFEFLPAFAARIPHLRWINWMMTAAIVITLGMTSWRQIQPQASTQFLAGTGGVPGGREAGAWIKTNVPLHATLATIGPSMANILKFYGERDAYGLSVSPNPLHRNPSYTPILNPDAQIRRSELQYLVWDSFSAARSPFFSDKLMGYVYKYNGRAVHTESITVKDDSGKTISRPVIIIYEVHP